MNTRTKKETFVVIVFLVIIMNIACTSFDARGYVTAILDTNFKHENKEYVRLTGETQESADEIYSDNVSGLLSSFLSEKTVSDDITKQGEAVFGTILESANYSVGQVREVENGYAVDVTFRQMQIFAEAKKEYSKQIDEYTQKLQKKAAAGGEVPDEQELNNQVSKILLDILQKIIDQKITYADEKVLTIHVIKDDENMYSIDNNDYKQIISYAMDSDTVE